MKKFMIARLVAVLAKAEAKDAAGLSAEMKTLTGSCGACHKAHKK